MQRMSMLLVVVLIGCVVGHSTPAPRARSASGASVEFKSPLNLIAVDVRINGGKPIPFILDTGEDETLIDSKVAEQLALRIEDPQEVAVPGGKVRVGRIPQATLSISTLSVEKFPLKSAPIGDLMAGVVGLPIGGILGHDFLQRYSIKIDYSTMKLTFWSPEQFPDSGPSRFEVPVSIEKGEVFLPVVVKAHGRPQVAGKFKLDTGSVDLLGMNNNFVVGNNLVQDGEPKLVMTGLAMGGETAGCLFRLEWTRVGGTTFLSPTVGYTTDSKGFENRPDAGTIGSAILSRFTVTLDYSRKRIILQPRRGSRELVPYDQVGILMNAAGPDLKTVVAAHVFAGTPAAEAGVREGDKIIEVNGMKGQSSTELWERFRHQGAFHVKVVREDGPHDVTIHARALVPMPSGPRRGAPSN
jgi:hypothetical protein